MCKNQKSALSTCRSVLPSCDSGVSCSHQPPVLTCASTVSLLAADVQVPLDLLRGLSHKLAGFLVFMPVLHLTFSGEKNNKMNETVHQQKKSTHLM